MRKRKRVVAEEAPASPRAARTRAGSELVIQQDNCSIVEQLLRHGKDSPPNPSAVARAVHFAVFVAACRRVSRGDVLGAAILMPCVLKHWASASFWEMRISGASEHLTREYTRLCLEFVQLARHNGLAESTHVAQTLEELVAHVRRKPHPSFKGAYTLAGSRIAASLLAELSVEQLAFGRKDELSFQIDRIRLGFPNVVDSSHEPLRIMCQGIETLFFQNQMVPGGTDVLSVSRSVGNPLSQMVARWDKIGDLATAKDTFSCLFKYDVQKDGASAGATEGDVFGVAKRDLVRLSRWTVDRDALDRDALKVLELYGSLVDIFWVHVRRVCLYGTRYSFSSSFGVPKEMWYPDTGEDMYSENVLRRAVWRDLDFFVQEHGPSMSTEEERWRWGKFVRNDAFCRIDVNLLIQAMKNNALIQDLVNDRDPALIRSVVRACAFVNEKIGQGIELRVQNLKHKQSQNDEE
ncbi:hypothetical protein FVE85_1882 [Porphyridium purpureum]|uniref:Uncharacterized protein n=1 Tax=Porphyridium purpureum TaxID=35688 RepID=A0A5J4YZ39_PORPP|nr:hypothetical protein FVE85_1882 [Porphyridium purpureum]|eukprot:POR2761..scf209_3